MRSYLLEGGDAVSVEYLQEHGIEYMQMPMEEYAPVLEELCEKKGYKNRDEVVLCLVDGDTVSCVRSPTAWSACLSLLGVLDIAASCCVLCIVIGLSCSLCHACLCVV